MLATTFNKAVDPVVKTINQVARKTILSPLPKSLEDKPFYTSMWARLPSRVATGVAGDLQ